MANNTLYARERVLEIHFQDTTREYVFIALSARDKEMMLAEAQKIHAGVVKDLSTVLDTIKSVCQMQDREILVEGILQGEQDVFAAKAALTLTGDEQDCREKMTAKTEKLLQERRKELSQLDKEQLVTKLAGLEMDRRMQAAWACAVLDATLVRVLHDAGRQPLFSSVEKMKATVPADLLEKLYESLLTFLSESGDAQVFLKPHTFKK
ncbi:MAG TPA: hypothetical protein DCZ10_08850 [Pelotomaculum sp.]|nr:hypothetical protein [Pelotomaculum sp.]